MDKVLPAVIVVALVLAIFGALALAWRRGAARQSAFPPLPAAPADRGAALFRDDLLYVATTRAGQPLERIKVQSLGFRARAVVEVAATGILLELAGRAPVFIAAHAITGVGRATWTIDRVVGQDGLIFVRWTWGETEVDSYLRSDDPDALITALTPLAPPAPADASGVTP